MKTKTNPLITCWKMSVNRAKIAAAFKENQLGEPIFANMIFVMMSGRIPDSFEEFHNYLTVILPWLQQTPTGGTVSNGENLGMTALNVTKCGTMLAQWTSGDSLNPKIYENEANKRKRNSETAEAFHNFEKDFNDWFRTQLDLMDASPNMDNNTRAKLHIKPKATTHHRQTGRIEEIPEVVAEAAGAGNIKLVNRVPNTATRPGLPSDSNGVEVTYACWGKDCPTQVELAPKWKATEPVTDADCIYRESHTQAVFEVDVNTAFSGMRIKGWVRYIDTHDLKRAGKWSNPFTIVVP